MNFVVYEEVAEIQNIEFTNEVILKVNGVELSAEMNFDLIRAKLELKPRSDSFHRNYILLYPKESLDEHYILEFKNQKLFKFDRYEPC